MQLDKQLLIWCTPVQKTTLKSVNKEGSIGKAAKALGLSKSTVQCRIDAIKRKAATSDSESVSKHEQENIVQKGYFVKSFSTLYDGDGNVKTKRVTSHRDKEDKLIWFKEAIVDVVNNYKGCSTFIKPPNYCNSDLLSVYPIPDPHIGMLSWARETGTAYNLDIAEYQLFQTVDMLVARSPSSSHALMASLGDLFHTDNSTNMTLAHGNILDVDSRYPKMISVGLRLMRRVIDRLLQKHEHVTAWFRQGNHDTHSSIMMAISMAAIYDNNPRVTISIEPGQFDVLQHGKCLIACTHGHTVAAAKLPLLLAERHSKLWGKTKFRHWYTGHIHHDQLIEYPGCIVEKLRAVCPKDAWSHGMGFESGRDLKCDVWHKTEGKIDRLIQRVGK
jgi:hypothetical protein